MKTDDLENIHNFMLKNCVYLDLCTKHGSNLVPGKTLGCSGSDCKIIWFDCKILQSMSLIDFNLTGTVNSKQLTHALPNQISVYLF